MSRQVSTRQLVHRPSHQSLLRAGPRIGGPRLPVDAIVVPAGRDVSHLAHAAGLAVDSGAELVVLCSGAARAADVAALAADRPGLRWCAVDLPDGYRHALLDFATSSFAEAILDRHSDLSVKRNLGLLLARLLGWRRILFLDDDIRGLSMRQLRRAETQLGTLDAVGVHVPEFPDNSVVCHAHRLTGGRQGVFVGGSALAVDTAAITSFFPDVYNEDWLFLHDSVRRGAVGTVGTVTQLAYDPYADPARARSEEFGDVLAEGLYWLLHSGAGSAEADSGFWADFLQRRKAFIAGISELVPGMCQDVGLAGRVQAALDAAADAQSSISPVRCDAYLDAWRADLAAWASRLGRLPRLPNIQAALRHLDLFACMDRKDSSVTASVGRATEAPAAMVPMALVDPVPTPSPLAAPTAAGLGPGELMPAGKARPLPDLPGRDIDPTATVAATAVIAAANRKLQEGEWHRESTVTTIGPGAEIGHFSLVGEGATVGADTIVDAYVHIEGGATIGARVIATHRATIGARARIGDDSVIGGFVCERSVVGSRCRVFGALVHRQFDPTIPWDAPAAEEASPVIADGAFVGFGAKVIGGIEIGAGAYVCAGAVVTRSVPPAHIAYGVNTVVPAEKWSGGLRRSPFFGVAAARVKWLETLHWRRWSRRAGASDTTPALAGADEGTPAQIAG